MTITILDEDKNPIDIVAYSHRIFPAGYGLYLVPNNSIILGEDRYREWDMMAGDASAQRKLLSNLVKVNVDIHPSYILDFHEKGHHLNLRYQCETFNESDDVKLIQEVFKLVALCGLEYDQALCDLIMTIQGFNAYQKAGETLKTGLKLVG